MQHLSKHVSRLVAIAVVAAGILLASGLRAITPEANQSAGGSLTLRLPDFLRVAHADSAHDVDVSFLFKEAGVTAYTKLNTTLDLSKYRASFKSVRQQTDQFISGIVIAPGYEKLPEFAESAEVQVYLQRDGWIVAYLTKYQPAAALFDWVSYDEKRLNSTLIESVVRKYIDGEGVKDFNIGYYDFRFPDATNLVMAADKADVGTGQNDFSVNIPRELSILEASSSVAASKGAGATCSLYSSDRLGYAANSSQPKWTFINLVTNAKNFTTGETRKIVLSRGYSIDGAGSYCGLAFVYKL